MQAVKQRRPGKDSALFSGISKLESHFVLQGFRRLREPVAWRDRPARSRSWIGRANKGPGPMNLRTPLHDWQSRTRENLAAERRKMEHLEPQQPFRLPYWQ